MFWCRAADIDSGHLGLRFKFVYIIITSVVFSLVFYRLIIWLIIIIHCSIIIYTMTAKSWWYFVALAHALWDKYYYYCHYMGKIILQARKQIVNNNVLGR